MLKRIKTFLETLLNNTLTPKDDITYKINYLKHIDIDPYTTELMDLDISTISKDIHNATKEIQTILSSEYTNGYIDVKRIHSNNMIRKTVTEWFTHDGNLIINKKEVWLAWLNTVVNIIELYNYLKHNVDNHYMHGNSLSIQPYVIECTNIVEILYVHYKKI